MTLLFWILSTGITGGIVGAFVFDRVWSRRPRPATLRSALRADREESARLYPQVSRFMSLATFRRMRAESILDIELFGDGTNAPTWPRALWNQSTTLHRGVWCDDGFPRPSNNTLDRFREDWRAKHPDLPTRSTEPPLNLVIEPGESVTVTVPIKIERDA